MFVNRKISKRRSHIRYPIELDAELILENSVTTPCVILNFCTAGLFLELKPSAARPPLDKNCLIRFAVSSYVGAETFEFPVRVMHVQSSGFGVISESMPIPAFNSLLGKINTGGKSQLGDRRGSAADRENEWNFKNAFKQLLLARAPVLLTNFFDAVGDFLSQSHELPDSFLNSSAIDDLITTLNRNKALFSSEFCGSLAYQVDCLPSFNKKIELQDFAGEKSLALIEKEDFEDWLNLAAVIRKLNNHFEEPLQRLDDELCRIFGVSRDAINNPAGPEILCESFRELVLQLELNHKVSAVLYNVFEKALIDGLTPVYEQLYSLLARQKSSGTPAPLPAPRAAAVNPDGKNPARRHNEAETWRRPVAAAEAGWNEFSFPEHKTSQPPAFVAGRLLDILGEIHSYLPDVAGNALARATDDNPAANRRFYTDDEIAAAFSALQHNLGAEDRDLHHDPGVLRQRLQGILQSGAEDAKALSSQDIRRLELYGKFFEIIFNDLQLSADIRPVLENIHLPLLSLAMRGDDFLEADTHPARNILDQLAVLQSGMRGNGSLGVKAKNTLEKLIARISSEAIGNPSVLEEVERELAGVARKTTLSIENNIKHIAENYQSKQNQEIAGQLVRLEIDKRLAGKFVPAIIPTLLEAGWRKLLIGTELEGGEAGSRKQSYWRVLDDLLTWLFEQDSILKMQAASIQKSLEFIREGLAAADADPARTVHIVEELTAMLLGGGQPKTRKSIKMVKMAATSANGLDQVDGELMLLVEQLVPGDWVMMRGGSKGGEPMKLVLLSEDRQSYVFVNRVGLNKLKLHKHELVMLFLSGAAHIMENLDTPLVERTSQLMLQKIHEQLIHTATHDPATGLLTREEFIKQLKTELSSPGRSRHMLCHMEILDFRAIIHNCGIDGGVELLKSLAGVVREQLRNEELFAKLGDKSLAILFRHCSKEDGYEIAKKLLKAVNDAPFRWQDKSFAVDVGMGLVPCDEFSHDAQQLLKQADSASLSAETSAQSRIVLFNTEDETIKQQNKLYEWAGQINNVFSQDRLFVRCQMIAPIDPEKNRHWHYEILLGVKDENGGVIPPDHFIPAVERCKRMPEIDRWIIGNVFAWIAKNRNVFSEPLGFAINLSGQSINSEAFLNFLTDLIVTGDVPPDNLVFEITETVAAANVAFTKKFIKTIKQFGCKFSLDDFGSGYSSYAYLKNLHVDYVKIDGAFIKDIIRNKADYAIVKSINEISHSLGMETIAEYVENNEILAILREIGVDYAQGYGIGKPGLLSELTNSMQANAAY